tara:strand:+ start:17 stop:370 length:354 start_codon:yes stop_codon:yes gene_type:complete
LDEIGLYRVIVNRPITKATINPGKIICHIDIPDAFAAIISLFFDSLKRVAILPNRIAIGNSCSEVLGNLYKARRVTIEKFIELLDVLFNSSERSIRYVRIIHITRTVSIEYRKFRHI